jgi:twitching motility protein PilT
VKAAPPEPPAVALPATPSAEEAVVAPMTRTVRIEVPPRTIAARQSTVERLLRAAAARGASALYLSSQSRPYIRVDGDMRVLDGEAPLGNAEVEAAVFEVIPEAARDSVRRGEPTEWIAEIADLGRIRCSSFRDHRGPGALFRMISTRAATAELLLLAREEQALATEADGLVLVAGPRGSGKSTLISAFVDLINRQRADYVITLERQLRLLHDNRAALISQREVRGNADEMLTAARAALRENPDVFVVEDLNSAEMVPLVLDAAGQGLLVFASLTVPSATDAVQHLVNLVPPERRAAAHAALAETFRGAIAQVLLHKTGGGRVAARELLLGTGSVTRLIADGQLGELPLALEGGRRHGMVPFTDTLVGLVQGGIVDVREAYRKAGDRERLLAGLRREGIDTSFVERLA